MVILPILRFQIFFLSLQRKSVVADCLIFQGIPPFLRKRLIYKSLGLSATRPGGFLFLPDTTYEVQSVQSSSDGLSDIQNCSVRLNIFHASSPALFHPLTTGTHNNNLRGAWNELTSRGTMFSAGYSVAHP